MKRSYKKILIIEILSIVVLIFNLIILKKINIGLIIGLLTSMLIALILAVGYEKNNQVYQKDMMMNIVIFMISYYILIYLFGLKIGFIKSIYSTNCLSILRNISPILIIILLEELVRYELIIKGSNNKLLLTLCIFIFIIIDIVLESNKYDIFQIEGLFKIIMLVVIPSLFRNINLSYVTYKLGYKVASVYMIFKKIPVYIIPIYPNLGIYIETIVEIIINVVLFLIIYSSLNKPKKNYIRKRKSDYLYLSISLLLFIIILLNSGYFTYSTLTIATYSMKPNINRGDIVVIRKVDQRETPKVKDIIAFNNDENITVVHRIVKSNKSSYYTKGDNNDVIDSYIVKRKDIIGKVKFRIPSLGMPSVWIKEVINRK